MVIKGLFSSLPLSLQNDTVPRRWAREHALLSYTALHGQVALYGHHRQRFTVTIGSGFVRSQLDPRRILGAVVLASL